MLINNVNIKFGNKIIYKDFSINLEDKKINCIVGPSGCGKTTLLNHICDNLLKENIKVSYVFQEDRLIPWKSVFDNLRLIINNKYNIKYINEKIDDILKILDIEEIKYLYPDELSGGMKQKVNIARALLYDSDVLLLDEPFRSLDIKIKNSIISFIRTINIKKEITIILVSHNKDEVDALADKVFLLGGCPAKVIIKGNKTIINDVFSSIIR